MNNPMTLRPRSATAAGIAPLGIVVSSWHLRFYQALPEKTGTTRGSNLLHARLRAIVGVTVGIDCAADSPETTKCSAGRRVDEPVDEQQSQSGGMLLGELGMRLLGYIAKRPISSAQITLQR